MLEDLAAARFSSGCNHDGIPTSIVPAPELGGEASKTSPAALLYNYHTACVSQRDSLPRQYGWAPVSASLPEIRKISVVDLAGGISRGLSRITKTRDLSNIGGATKASPENQSDY